MAKNRQGDTGKMALIFRPDLGTIREEATHECCLRLPVKI